MFCSRWGLINHNLARCQFCTHVKNFIEETPKGRNWSAKWSIISIYVDLCARSRYQGQGKVIISHRDWGMLLLVPSLDTYFWHTHTPHINFCSTSHEICLIFRCSRAGTSNYIPQILWDVITCPCPWYLLLTHTHNPHINFAVYLMKTCIVFCYSRAGTSNYIPKMLWGVITCPCPWYLFLTHIILISNSAVYLMRYEWYFVVIRFFGWMEYQSLVV